MTVLLLLALTGEVRVNYRLVECAASAVKPDLERQELRRLWREARELAAFEVTAREFGCVSASKESHRTYLAGYSRDRRVCPRAEGNPRAAGCDVARCVRDRRPHPRTERLREGVRLMGWSRRKPGGADGVILDTWINLAEGGEFREFKTRWGRIELPSALFGGAGTSALLREKKVTMVCWWQVPGKEARVYALLARAEQVRSVREVRALGSSKEAARAAPFEYVVPSFIDGDVEMEPEVGESGKALIARRAPPPPGKPLFAAMRLLKVKAALFDSLNRRPGEKELESWVRRKEAEVIGQAGLSCMEGRWAGACWARRKANLSGLSEGGTSVRWVAAGAAVGLRAELEGEYVRVEARAWASEFDEPFRLKKTSLGRVELPDFRFSSTGECRARLKLGEEGVVGAAALDDGMMLLLTAKVAAVSK